MPYPSVRRAFLQEAEATFELAILEDIEQGEDDLLLEPDLSASLRVASSRLEADVELLEGDAVDEALEVLLVAEHLRYIAPRVPWPRSEFYIETIYPQLNDVEFRQLCRMSRDSFEAVLSLICPGQLQPLPEGGLRHAGAAVS